ncbi:MAG: lipoprotein [Acutalibacteraceae bacterium]
MKKAISMILILSAVISLTACGSKNNNETTEQKTTSSTTVSTTSQTTQATSVPSTEKNSTTHASTKSVTNNFLEANKEDKETFCKTIEQILWANGWFAEDLDGKLDYDCSTKDAYEIAIDRMISCPYYDLMDTLNDIYGSNNYTFEPETDEKDPKKIMDDNFYKKISGEKFDSVLKNVFNIEPDHKYTMSDSYNNKVVFYYYNGYYYIQNGDGGDGAGPKVTIESITRQNDGKYNIKILYQIVDYTDDAKDMARLDVVAALKSVKGDRLWSFYKIKTTEIYDHELVK